VYVVEQLDPKGVNPYHFELLVLPSAIVSQVELSHMDRVHVEDLPND